MTGRLSALQETILGVLGRLDPPPVVTGGAALAAFYTRHRTTRDVDAFWRDRAVLGDVSRAVIGALETQGLSVSVLQRTPAFARLRVARGEEVCLLDLVAEPVTTLEPPVIHVVRGVDVAADSPYEILVAKLCTLLERAELRDLLDVMVLVEAGGDLTRAVADAPVKDGGFSALTLAWVLETTPFEALAAGSDLDAPTLARLEAFRRSLIDLLTQPPPER